MTKVIVDKERLDQLLDMFITSCPLDCEVAKEGEISICGLETCLSDENYCWKEWLKAKELPQEKEEGYPNDDYTIGVADGWNMCLGEILGKEKDE